MQPGYYPTAQPYDGLPYSYWTVITAAELGGQSQQQFFHTIGLPTNDTLYAVGAVGPSYQGPCGQYNDYGACCAVSPSNAIDGIMYESQGGNKQDCGGPN
jgi:hypothetical protein